MTRKRTAEQKAARKLKDAQKRLARTPEQIEVEKANKAAMPSNCRWATASQQNRNRRSWAKFPRQKAA